MTTAKKHIIAVIMIQILNTDFTIKYLKLRLNVYD